MGFEWLRFFNFRNLKDRQLAIDAPQVFLVGPNGQGKTNLLEAVHLLCLGSSFRESRESAFARDPSDPVGLAGSFVTPEAGTRQLSLHMAEGRRKELRVDDKLLPDRRGLFAEVLCLCFVQQDIDFVTGSPEERRRFFDQTLVLYDPGYLEGLRSYRQVLRSRNVCLRDRREDLLDAYDAQLAAHGLFLQQRRAELIREFDGLFTALLSEISGSDQEVRIRYSPAWGTLHATDDVLAHLGSRRQGDLLVGATTSGPHRDMCSYVCGSRDYVPFASNGQLRLCALALRVAQARFLSARRRRRPVLLVDDVLLELDPARRGAFLARFPPFEQALFTFLPDESWRASQREDTLVLEVEAGEFRRHGELL
jgi:DNA replication and repair protein RecF